MNALHAAVLVSRNTDASRPLMLSPMLFRPVLGWIAESLRPAGVGTFFAVCREADRQAASDCLTNGQTLVFSGDAACAGVPAGDVLVFTRPAIVSRQAVEDAVQFLTRTGLEAVSLIDEEGCRTGVYYVKNVAVSWVLERLAREEGFETALEGEGLAPGELDHEQGVVCLSDFASLRTAQQALRTAVIAAHMENGVNFLDPASALIGPEVTIGEGTTVLPGVILRGKTAVGRDCELGPNAMLCDAVIGDGTTVNASQIFESSVGTGVKIGPFAYIRPGCRVGDNIKIGDFVELKNARVGSGSKIPHLSYVGDAEIGEKVNIGCGSITVNYDGHKKYTTRVGDGAFIGCNSNLVAPVSVGDGAYTAAGSTITGDVPAGALAIARARQVIKEDWVEKIHNQRKR